MAHQLNDKEMMMTQARLKTFKSWPFDEDSSCTPLKMAEAGFYCCGSVAEPDLVRCFFCRKELDGWDPEDDPWSEHVGHAKGKCGFVNLGKKSDELTVQDMYNLFPQKYAMVVSKMLQNRIEMFKKEAEGKRKELEKLL
jgi:baculoviral IAP repeat-containing protein 5